MSPIDLPLTGAVTCLMLLVYFWTATVAAKARKTFNVPAPAIDGPEGFRRIYRSHENTLEQLVLTLPAVWLFAAWVSDLWAALAGLIWCVGRVAYVRGYAAEQNKRGTGFMIGLLATGVCLIGSLVVIVMHLLA